MKPETSTQGFSYEKPLNISEGSRGSAFQEIGIESRSEVGTEVAKPRSEMGSQFADMSSSIILPTPISQITVTEPPAVISDFPLVANDDELIEKEWVDRAKKIVSDTKDDPHKRDEEVNKLQADYIKKRYGRELGGAL